MLVRHLMSHTSGLIYGFIQPNAPISKAWAAGGENRNDLTAREYARLLAGLPLKSEPGAAFNYSHSTDVLGAVVEVAGGKPLDVLVRERVTGPLGMTDTLFWQPEAGRARFAEPKNNQPGVYFDYARPTPYLSGGGGMSSTTEDYLRFVLMLAGNGEYKGVRILKPATLLRMRQDETTPEIRRAGLFFPGPGLPPGAGRKGAAAGGGHVFLVGHCGHRVLGRPQERGVHGVHGPGPRICAGIPAQEPRVDL
jgi:CubicO group peptidase (beta-lactamase class C family)